MTKFPGLRARTSGSWKRPGLAEDLLRSAEFTILSVNIRGLISHLAELAASIRLMPSPPSLVCLHETFLNRSIEDICLEGYQLVARRDRDDGRKCGGVAVFAEASIAERVTLLERSRTSERV